MTSLARLWASDANCFGMGDAFFSDDTRRAKFLCSTCPIRDECLAFALDRDVPYGVWGGTTFEERCALCPVCQEPKDPAQLGCTPVHSERRLARLVQQQRDGDLTVSVARRGVVTPATEPGCVIPRGRSHSTAKAYRQGCRCAAARAAKMTEHREGPRSSAPPPRTIEQRFLDMVAESDGHWIWQGALNGSGRGNFWDGKKTRRAHLVARELWPLVGAPVACDLRLCVNPSHRRPAELAA